MTVTLLTASGTWAPWDIGYPADIARAVTPGEWDPIWAELQGLELEQRVRLEEAQHHALRHEE